MAPQHVAFRSQSEREKEKKLLVHYRQIGIAAIAAAAAAVRRHQPSVPQLATRPSLGTAK